MSIRTRNTRFDRDPGHRKSGWSSFSAGICPCPSGSSPTHGQRTLAGWVASRRLWSRIDASKAPVTWSGARVLHHGTGSSQPPLESRERLHHAGQYLRGPASVDLHTRIVRTGAAVVRRDAEAPACSCKHEPAPFEVATVGVEAMNDVPVITVGRRDFSSRRAVGLGPVEPGPRVRGRVERLDQRLNRFYQSLERLARCRNGLAPLEARLKLRPDFREGLPARTCSISPPTKRAGR